MENVVKIFSARMYFKNASQPRINVKEPDYIKLFCSAYTTT
jgi:hypothetical protein